MGAKTIAVLLHETDAGFQKSNYLLRAMLPLWERAGFGIRTFRGISHAVPADVLFPHIDLTVWPEPYRRFMEQYATVVNRTVVSNAKTRVSTNLVRAGDGYTGPVIVKTDNNYGGMPEWRLEQAAGPDAIAPGSCSWSGPADWSRLRFMRTKHYPIFASAAEVPPEVFRNSALVVEKFLPERDGDHYCLRYCYFLGDREVGMRFRGTDPVVKGTQSISCEQVETPADCLAIRERLGFDYGKFDYVIRDGKTVLFDVSRTPAVAMLGTHPHMRWMVAHLAEGIHSILDRAS